MSSSTRIFVTVGINSLIHLAFLVVGIVALHYGVASQKILNPTLLASLSLNNTESIPYFVADAITQAEKWVLYVTLDSFVISTIWLLFSNAVSPAGPTQARSRLGAWFAALVLLITSSSALAWWIFVHKHIAANLSERFLTPLLVISGVCVLLAFYLGCAIGIKPAMRPSVPLADAWRR